MLLIIAALLTLDYATMLPPMLMRYHAFRVDAATIFYAGDCRRHSAFFAALCRR